MRGIQRKDVIRKEVLELLTGMKTEEKIAKDEKIFSRFLSDPDFLQSENIMFYISFKKEVETRNLIENAIAVGKKVFVPVIDKRRKNMHASELRSLDEAKSGNFGIDEPEDGFLRIADSGNIDTIVVPGIAFDMRCNRIGRGLGFYDRFLARLSGKARFIALAYDVQILENIPITEADVPMNKIITETRTITR